MINCGRQRFISLSGAILATVLLLGACGGGGGDDEADDGDAPVPKDTATTLPPGTTYFAEANAAEVAVYDQADGTAASQTLANPIESGAPLVFLVDGTDVDGTRLPVYLPVQPNGSKGWVDKAQVKLSTNPYHLKVELGAHKLTLTNGGETVIESSVGLGRVDRGWNTPEGNFYLKELLENPNPDDVYGPYAYGISAFTENPEIAAQFGGDGVVGLHGTNDPSSIGKDSSHGCIRLPNDVITELAGLLPLGTPIEIVA